MADLLVLPNQQRACRMAQALAKKRDHTGPAGKEKGASALQIEQLGSTQEPLLLKVRAVCPSHQIMKWERVEIRYTHTLARTGNRSGSMERKGWTPQ